MTATVPVVDLLALHRAAIGVAQDVIDGVTSDQFDLPTPCSEWNVRQLLTHLIGGNLRTSGHPPEPDVDIVGLDPAARYATASAMAIEAFEAPGGLVRDYQLSMGRVPGPQAIRNRISDQLAHAWDLARATGQPTDRDPELYEAALELSRQRFAATPGPTGLFADEQAPQAEAGASDRFVAFLGRQV